MYLLRNFRFKLFIACVLIQFSLTSFAQTSEESNPAYEVSIENIENFVEPKYTPDQVIMPSGRTFILQSEPSGEAQIETYNQLSDADKTIFFQNRNKIIGSILSKIDSDKKMNLLGKMIILKDKLVSYKLKLRGAKNTTEQNAELDKMKLGQEQVQKIVSVIDSKLWDQAKVVAKVNAKGKQFAVNGNFGFGIFKKGRLLNWSLGIGYYYNEETQKRYLEFFAVQEKFVEATTYAAPAFLGVRINWINWRNEDPNNLSVNEGKGTYLPAALPNIYINPNELQILSGLGIDFLDFVVPMQTFAQSYEVTWKRYSKRYDINYSGKNLCSSLFLRPNKQEK